MEGNDCIRRALCFVAGPCCGFDHLVRGFVLGSVRDAADALQRLIYLAEHGVFPGSGCLECVQNKRLTRSECVFLFCKVEKVMPALPLPEVRRSCEKIVCVKDAEKVRFICAVARLPWQAAHILQLVSSLRCLSSCHVVVCLSRTEFGSDWGRWVLAETTVVFLIKGHP